MTGLGLFATLNMGTRSLQTQQMGVEVAGHNLSNINNPNYSRQRVEIETSVYLDTPIGPEGTGASVVAIRQLRDQLLDDQITAETSLSGSLSGQQRALQYAQANLGQQIDRQASGVNAADTAISLAGQFGLAEGISTLFNSFQSVASSPRDATERTVLLDAACHVRREAMEGGFLAEDLFDGVCVHGRNRARLQRAAEPRGEHEG